MSDGLDIGCDEVVVFVGKVDIAGFERLEYALNDLDAFIRCTMLDNDLGEEVNRKHRRGWRGAVTKDAPVAGQLGARRVRGGSVRRQCEHRGGDGLQMQLFRVL